jgi:hypothetical protein
MRQRWIFGGKRGAVRHVNALPSAGIVAFGGLFLIPRSNESDREPGT